jgi:hypothetical protein
VIVAAAFAVTDVVVIANVAVLAPPATVTPAGTTAAALLLARVTAAPPVGATASRVTVPVEPVPPTTLAGAMETPERFAADAGTAAKTAARTIPRSPGLEVRFMELVPIPVVPESGRN